MGTRNNKAKQEQAAADQYMREANQLSREQFSAVRGFVDEMKTNRPENTEAARTLRGMGLDFLSNHAKGGDKGRFLSGQLNFINRMAANNREASKQSRQVGGRALSSGGDANLLAQLDFLRERENQEAVADVAPEIYDAALTDAMNQAVTGEGSMQNYDLSILGGLSGVAGLAQGNQQIAFQQKQWANRPGQGIFSRFVSPFAQGAMSGLFGVFCIAEDMDVLTSESGYQVAANIRPGDKIKTLGPRGLEDCVVTDILYKHEPVLRVHFKTEEGGEFFLDCTESHWFACYLGDTYGCEAAVLTAGDFILGVSKNGKAIECEVTNVEELEEKKRVCNFVTSSPWKNFITAGVVSLDGQE